MGRALVEALHTQALTDERWSKERLRDPPAPPAGVATTQLKPLSRNTSYAVATSESAAGVMVMNALKNAGPSCVTQAADGRPKPSRS